MIGDWNELRLGSSTIDFASMRNRKDQHSEVGIIYLINNPVIANPNSIIRYIGQVRPPVWYNQKVARFAQDDQSQHAVGCTTLRLAGQREISQLVGWGTPNCASNLAFTCAHGRGSSDSPKASRAAFKSDAFSNASSSVKSSISDTTRLARESESVSSFEIASANSTLLTLEACQSRMQFQVRERDGATAPAVLANLGRWTPAATGNH